MITQYGSLRRSLTKCEFEVKMLLGILLQSKGVTNVQNSNYVKPGTIYVQVVVGVRVIDDFIHFFNFPNFAQ